MARYLSNCAACCVLVISSVVCGCRQVHKEEAVVRFSVDPNLLTDAQFVMPPFVLSSLEATGGRQGWAKAGTLELDCEVTFYELDKSYYLTEQRYRVCPWTNSLMISAKEPRGKILWKLSGERFEMAEGDERIAALPAEISGRRFAEAVLNIMTAPIRLLDKSNVLARSTEPVKIDGLWYYRIDVSVPGANAQTSLQKMVVYQNRDHWFLDVIQIGGLRGSSEEFFFTVRGYDYSRVEGSGVIIPKKVEVFRENGAGTLRQRLVKIGVRASSAQREID